ncbi:MAG: ABC transporter ATP-binding protein [Deltaproteobacteria bacterium]|nr:ABC transporter ATP-binding protein [Deltaproteobacteria bacterium]
MIAIELRAIAKKYGRSQVLKDVDLSVEAGTFAVVFGLPACGKSVLVRLLTGLEKPSAGRILLRGTAANKIDSGGRNIGYVPQSFALYPHFSVYDNISYPLDLINYPKPQIDRAVRQIAVQLKIDHLLSKKPDQLSGGEKQRVALARGVVKHTDIYILDDPLVGLDFKLREQMFDDLKQMQQSLAATFLYTTSDPLEALALADKVAILDGGRIVEAGDLEVLYRRPAHITTMALLGFPASNQIGGELFSRADQLWCRTGLFELPVSMTAPADLPAEIGDVRVVVRPEDIHLNPDQDGMLKCQAQVVLLEDLGSEVIVYLEVNKIPLVTVISHAEDHLVSNDKVTVGVRPSKAVLFNSETGQKIGQGAD